jgi:hypothetical protein
MAPTPPPSAAAMLQVTTRNHPFRIISNISAPFVQPSYNTLPECGSCLSVAGGGSETNFGIVSFTVPLGSISPDVGYTCTVHAAMKGVFLFFEPTPSSTPTASQSASVSQSLSPSASQSPSGTATQSASQLSTPSRSSSQAPTFISTGESADRGARWCTVRCLPATARNPAPPALAVTYFDVTSAAPLLGCKCGCLGQSSGSQTPRTPQPSVLFVRRPLQRRAAQP